MNTEKDLLATAHELADIFLQDPEALDEELLSRGDNWIEILHFESDETLAALPEAELNQLKIKTIKDAILDLSNRGKVFASAFIGLTYYEGLIQPFIAQIGEQPLGDVVFSIHFRHPDLLQKWRMGEDTPIDDDVINDWIYRLTWEWASLNY